jgi:putative Holliday junction resolvase
VRALGLDLGDRRIGVAVSDSDRRVATPIETITRGRDHTVDHGVVAALIEEWEAGVVVVGVPFSLDGSVGPAAQKVLVEVDELARALVIPVETVDERFTTVTATDQLRAGGLKGRDRAKVIDQTAAAVLLQAWLDRQETPPC